MLLSQRAPQYAFSPTLFVNRVKVIRLGSRYKYALETSNALVWERCQNCLYMWLKLLNFKITFMYAL